MVAFWTPSCVRLLLAEDAFEVRYPNQSDRVRECVGMAERSSQELVSKRPAGRSHHFAGLINPNDGKPPSPSRRIHYGRGSWLPADRRDRNVAPAEIKPPAAWNSARCGRTSVM